MQTAMTNLVTMVHKGITVFTKGFDKLDEAVATAKSLALGAGIVEVLTEDREWKCENGASVAIEVI